MTTPTPGHAGMAGHGQQSGHGDMSPHHPYRRLAAMMLLSFVAMYGLMYAMVDRLDHVLASWNQVYMAGVMAGAMLVMELAVMGKMYPDRARNRLLLALGVVATGLCWFGIRGQWGIDDSQFLRSMIPHHAGAILMCEEAPVADPQVQALCAGIVANQEAEIAQMQALLARRR